MEEPLPAGGACLLGSLNLNEFIDESGELNDQSFVEAVDTAVKALNDVLDEGADLHPLPEQRKSVKEWRQIGLGVMGMADALYKCGLAYDDDNAIKAINKIGHLLITTALITSVALAVKEGTFPKCNKKNLLKSPFLRNVIDKCEGLDKIIINNLGYADLFGSLEEGIKKYGLRNSQLLTTAPTGSISNLLGVSGGIEPIFSHYYSRTTKSLHAEGDVEYHVYSQVYLEHLKKKGLWDGKTYPNKYIEVELDDIAVVSNNINFRKRVEIQAAWQEFIDASISSTVNLPFETTVEEVEDLYMYAYEQGLKGLTIYRAGCSRGAILVDKAKKKEEKPESEFEKVSDEEVQGMLKRGELAERADDVIYYRRKVIIGCGSLILMIGYSPSEKKVHDLYIIKSGSNGCEKNIQAQVIYLSMMLRLGADIKLAEEALAGISACPSFISAANKGIKVSKGSNCPRAIYNTIKQFLKEVEENKIVVVENAPTETEDLNESTQVKPELKKQVVQYETCPECGEKGILNTGGCVQCIYCGYSKCE